MPNGPADPTDGDASDALPGTELAPKVYDAEFVADDAAPGRSNAVGPWTASPLPARRGWAQWRRWAFWFAGTAARVWRSGPVMRARSVAAYRVRKLPQDVVRLAWFVL